MAFTFVHVADLHLDSPFRASGDRPPHVARALESATFDALDRLIVLCVERQVAFLLVAGDIYDGADKSLRAQLAFRDALAKLDERGIASFIVHGNHDPLDGWSSSIRWPKTVRVFGGHDVETVLFPADGTPIAAIAGISYPARAERRNLVTRFCARHPDLFQIALLHCNCGGNAEHEAYAPCRLDELTSTGLDYWALGHVHTRGVLAEYPHVVYPGNTQGRNINEPGERGAYIATVENNRVVALEFEPLDSVRWARRDLAIAGHETVDDLEIACMDVLENARQAAAGRAAIVRLRLTGRGPLHRELNQEAIATILERLRDSGAQESPFVWVEQLESHCAPEIDLGARRARPDLLGQLLAILDELRGDEDIVERLAPVFKDLHDQKDLREHLALSPEDLRALLDDAEYLCADLLEDAQ